MSEPFVIRRHGAFFRPDAAGYTTHIGSAGFYTEAEARKYLDAEGVTVHPLTEFRDQADAVLAGADRLRAALSLPTPTVDREAIARVIHPGAFDDTNWDDDDRTAQRNAKGYALDKADRILALLHPIDDISETGEAG